MKYDETVHKISSMQLEFEHGLAALIEYYKINLRFED